MGRGIVEQNRFFQLCWLNDLLHFLFFKNRVGRSWLTLAFAQQMIMSLFQSTTAVFFGICLILQPTAVLPTAFSTTQASFKASENQKTT